MNIYADGSGWNGREAKITVLIEEKKLIRRVYKTKKTNNEMEYKAVLEALRIAGPGDKVFTDSQLVVNQLKGEWKIKQKSLFPFYAQAKALLEIKSDVILVWIPREENKAGFIK